jgi:ribosomal protein L27
MGRDHTLFALEMGRVSFVSKRQKKLVTIIPYTDQA